MELFAHVSFWCDPDEILLIDESNLRITLSNRQRQHLFKIILQLFSIGSAWPNEGINYSARPNAGRKFLIGAHVEVDVRWLCGKSCRDPSDPSEKKEHQAESISLELPSNRVKAGRYAGRLRTRQDSPPCAPAKGCPSQLPADVSSRLPECSISVRARPVSASKCRGQECCPEKEFESPPRVPCTSPSLLFYVRFPTSVLCGSLIPLGALMVASLPTFFAGLTAR